MLVAMVTIILCCEKICFAERRHSLRREESTFVRFFIVPPGWSMVVSCVNSVTAV